MRSRILWMWLAVLWVCAGSGWAQEQVHLYNKKLSATIPPGLYTLTAKAIKEEFTGKSPPQHVYKNRKGDYSIAFNHMQKPLAASDLLSFHAQLKQHLLSEVEGIQWLGDRSQSLQSQLWQVMEFKSPADGSMMHNWILLTSWKGRVLQIAVAAFDDLDVDVPAQVNAFINSVRLSE